MIRNTDEGTLFSFANLHLLILCNHLQRKRCTLQSAHMHLKITVPSMASNITCFTMAGHDRGSLIWVGYKSTERTDV